jgi:DNA-binding transcriptional regulator YiaG
MRELTPETIKAARVRLGLTQTQVAARIGCSALAVSFWERGTRTPTGLYAKAVRELITDAEALSTEDAATDDAFTTSAPAVQN